MVSCTAGGDFGDVFGGCSGDDFTLWWEGIPEHFRADRGCSEYRRAGSPDSSNAHEQVDRVDITCPQSGLSRRTVSSGSKAFTPSSPPDGLGRSFLRWTLSTVHDTIY